MSTYHTGLLAPRLSLFLQLLTLVMSDCNRKLKEDDSFATGLDDSFDTGFLPQICAATLCMCRSCPTMFSMQFCTAAAGEL